MNGVGKPCAGERHARFDRGPLGKVTCTSEIERNPKVTTLCGATVSRRCDYSLNQRPTSQVPNKYGLSGRNWATRFNYEWFSRLEIFRLTGTVRSGSDCSSIDVGKPCAGERHARFDRGPLGKVTCTSEIERNPKVTTLCGAT